MSVYDAVPGDLYADAQGKLWRVISVCPEPTVTVEEVEPQEGATEKRRRDGGVSGYMWNGYQRIFRPKIETQG